MNRAQIGILLGPKGRGSNMRAIAAACSDGRLNADVRVVISPKSDTPGVDWARSNGMNLDIVSPSDEPYGANLLAALDGCDWICLAGYLRLLPGDVLNAFPHRILNIHPALLPKFGGKGMYGMHVHEAVIAAGETESGCTVHYVTEHYDEGEIILQKRYALHPGETPESLAAAVLKLEHEAYVEALQKVIAG